MSAWPLPGGTVEDPASDQNFQSIAQDGGELEEQVATIEKEGLPPSGKAGGVLKGEYPNPEFAADLATQAELEAGLSGKQDAATAATDAELAAHAEDTTAIHGIADTSKLATKAEVEAKQDAASAATDAELAAHAADSTEVHGITDTSLLALKTEIPRVLRYKWLTDTENSDPGSGKMKANIGATILRISETDNDGNTIASYLATWDDSTNAVKGTIVIRQIGSPKRFAIVNVTGTLEDPGAYNNFTITLIKLGETLQNEAEVTVEFFRAGNVGATGAKGDTGPEPQGVVKGVKEEDLETIRGNVSSAGEITAGEGFTAEKTATGKYTIKFTEAFKSVPTIHITPIATALRAVNLVEPTTAQVTLETRSAAALVDTAFTATIIGPHS